MLRRCSFVVLVLTGLIATPALFAFQAKGAPAKAAAAPAGPVIVLEFAKGTVEIEAMPSGAPQSVEHILQLVRRGFYRGQRIWYVTPSLVEFGDPNTRDMTKRENWGTSGSGKMVGVDETKMSKQKFVRGVVGLGYRPDYNPKTADSFLFIIKGTNASADGKYAVIGKVTEGIAIVDKLEVTDVIRNAYIKGEKK
jgi:peptidyl-prolyl cis-trans isomerase B (cyclophilin B)